MKLELKNAQKDIIKDNDVVLICGDGKLLLRDIKIFLDWMVPHDAYCIGRSIKAYPGAVTHYADVDGDAGFWVAANVEKNNPDKVGDAGYICKHTLGGTTAFDFDWNIDGSPWDMDEILWHGSTGLFAVLSALSMGYKKIVLAGMPIDSKGHWYFPDEKYGPKWTMETYQAWFELKALAGSAKIRSLSGYTALLMGEPTKKWLIHGIKKRSPNKDNAGQALAKRKSGPGNAKAAAK